MFRAPVLGQLLIQFKNPMKISGPMTNINYTLFVNHTTINANSVHSSFYQFANHVWNDPYWLASMLVIMTVISTLIGQHSNIELFLLGSRMRVSCCSLIYRKVIHNQSIPFETSQLIISTQKIISLRTFVYHRLRQIK